MNRLKPLALVLFCTFLLIGGIVLELANNQQSMLLVSQSAPSEKVSQDVVYEDVLSAEYQVTWQDKLPFSERTGSYQAPNRAHNIRTYFMNDGIQVIPRQATETDWRWGLSFVGLSDGVATELLAPAELSTNGNRVSYKYDAVTEWYINDNRGVEQGFIVDKPIKGLSSSQLILELALTGNLTPYLATDGTAVEFLTADGAYVLQYSGLYAYDATMKKLPAQMALSKTAEDETIVQLVVDTAVAQYPIVIDPIITTPDWIAGVAQDANFGFSINTAGDVNNDGYDDVIVGANWYDNGAPRQGAAFVYLGSFNGLNSTYDWMATGGDANMELGIAVNGAGDVNNDGYDDIIIGSKDDAAFVFLGDAASVDTTVYWTGIGSNGSNYGVAVGGAGDVNRDNYDDIIVGAPTALNSQSAVAGQAYVYYGSNSGISASPDWTAESARSGTNFGISVGTAGDVNGDLVDDVIIGGDQYDPEGTVGVAVVYHGSDSDGPTGGPLATISDADWESVGNLSINAQFGFSVSTAGDINGDNFDDIIVGAPNENNGTGATFIYTGTVSGLSVLPIANSPVGNELGEFFGYSVSDAGDIDNDGFDDVIIGAPQYTEPAQGTIVNEGAIYIYMGTDAGDLQSFAALFLTGVVDDARFGTSVSTAGDVNSDGYADFVIGSPKYVGSTFGDGYAFGFHGTGAVAGLTVINDSPTEIGDPTLFTASISSPDSGLNSYSWSFGDDNVGSGLIVEHTYDTPGVYTATIDVSNPFGGTVSASTVVSVTQDSSVTPEGGGELDYMDMNGQGTNVQIPGGAVEEIISLSYTPLTTVEEPDPKDGSIPAGYYFDLDANEPDKIYLPLILNNSSGTTAVNTATSIQPIVNSANAECASDFCFLKPVTVTISYNQELLPIGINNEEDLRLYFWDPEVQDWIDAATTCDPESIYSHDTINNTFSVAVCHLTRFGVVGAN
ncbi:MAG: PKD domain-containing protein [Chloroflexi bacterium]|nr:PKD domain-containing protein [Chloroflexota bacterium]